MSSRKSPLKSPIYSTDNASQQCDTSLSDLYLQSDLLDPFYVTLCTLICNGK